MSPDPIQDVRPSAIAGRWYPGSATTLRRDIDRFFEAASPEHWPGRIVGLVAPHAGYAYSGPTAAIAFAQVRDAPFRRVVILGPLHRPIRPPPGGARLQASVSWGGRVAPCMVPIEDVYRTPLGDVPIDREFVNKLNSRIAMTLVRGDEEHALEIELPFLQVALDRFHLVPIMLGEHISHPQVVEWVTRLSEALAELVDEETLLVCSTDLSHMENYADVIRTDHRLIDLLNAFELDSLRAALQAGVVQACGATGLLVLLETCKRLGAKGAKVLQYTSSGDVTGEKRPGAYTVGYLAAVVHT